MLNNDKEIKTMTTFYLFANPSFVEGISRLLDAGGTLNIYNESSTAEEADYIALRNDWLTIGQDFRKAIS